ncbi:TPA: hypothetical protein ACIFTU_000601 [Escherichia coli]|uniref:hypothetical protein n=1 Tax=Escherichia coli TaxID=562 RepID=UPI000DA5850C|nr:hypothetical protein [Escherichia coli]MCZ9278206.1 hypothetical protein [Escherichia albertii]MBW8948244.1 hypothetical protein [Escherichia coli]QMP33955.1 hypothetical protein HVW10_16390 [Escherichia coli]SQS80677.1 Uncharacterised protein [Escherichia coli]HAM4717882.1 hypothetical protein [Escherichia coli]
MEFKGTKKNWREANFAGLILFSHPGMALSGKETEEAVANGRLAMAAPDLLEALQLLLKQAENRTTTTYPEWYGAVNKAREAIKKAIGDE